MTFHKTTMYVTADQRNAIMDIAEWIECKPSVVYWDENLTQSVHTPVADIIMTHSAQLGSPAVANLTIQEVNLDFTKCILTVQMSYTSYANAGHRFIEEELTIR